MNSGNGLNLITNDKPVMDLRNEGYQTLWTSVVAMYDTDSTRRANWLTAIASAVQKMQKYRQTDARPTTGT